MDFKRYTITITDIATNELEEIFDYISKNLKNEVATERLKYRIEKLFLWLEENPYLATKVHIKPRNQIYRRLVINNYIILYQVEEKKKQVIIHRVLYGRRDYLNII